MSLVSKNGKYLKAKAKKPSKFRSVLYSLPVILIFLAVTVVAWIIPLRPTVSDTEKRNLEKFPDFSVDALLDGTYFDDIGVWFSDTFTFRETWIDTASSLEYLYGSKTVAIYGDIGTSDDIPEINLSDNSTEAPTENEKTPIETAEPEEATEPTAEPQETEEEFDPREEDSTEEAPGDISGDAWGGQVIEEDEYIGNSAIIQIGNATYGITGFVQTYADKYSESMSKAAELLDGKARLFCLLGLENTTFMLTRDDRIKMGCKLEEDAIAYMYSNMDPRVHTVSVFDKLIAHNSEYLAFRTDHHWTATAAYYAYEEWCEEAGVEPVPLSEYEVMEFPGFFGTYYAKASKSHLLEADTVVAYVPPGNITLYLSDLSGDSLGWEQAVITDMSKSQSGAKYSAFLAGDHARGTLINDDITDGSSCLVVKTSIGNPFVYYLTQHYQYVYVLDVRYYTGKKLTAFVDHYGIDDVIFLHGTGLTTTSGGIGLINRFVK